MEWALAILFSAAVLLLIASFIKTRKSTLSIEKQLDQHSLTFLDEVNKLQEQINIVKLDSDIIFQETGILVDSPNQRILLREMLDLHKRGYSFKSIATKSKLSQLEVEQLLAPYVVKAKSGRGIVANDS